MVCQRGPRLDPESSEYRTEARSFFNGVSDYHVCRPFFGASRQFNMVLSTDMQAVASVFH